ncbi:hypothetical protein EN875_034000 [Mesorhizobium sp. M2D.F.Ca.ET.232.01.1.1]|uniref:hypothetical protein n=1 Tax=Mesorhizobium sp. M2D.F.Ca.ET.232.01.1.1 TaxID=2496670 RepID=UPI000FCC4407|nr:hypothetical protein [Mesorhizobium sp. M2D.F.Ca.ET.232.01.1.1]TGP27355.1 hypothetical protein EN875_034000 [Mesorhizobium sp. M2D.F.Ca.ET.232.01.1.1]
MNIVSEHDGFESRAGSLYLVEDSGSKYTLLATFESDAARDLFWDYLCRRPKTVNGTQTATVISFGESKEMIQRQAIAAVARFLENLRTMTDEELIAAHAAFCRIPWTTDAEREALNTLRPRISEELSERPAHVQHVCNGMDRVRT